jgi:AcrR family transcriptional regulator
MQGRAPGIDTLPYHGGDALSIRWRINRTTYSVTDDDGRAKWIEAGLAALARGGIEELRVEVLAKDLGVTKGGFYRRFADRRALLGAMLEAWAQGRIAAIAQQAKLDGVSARERLRELIRLYSETVNARGMALELAIRQWSRVDDTAAAVVMQVDAARLKNVATLYRALGYATEQAEAQALLFYSFIFGQSLLQLKQGQRRRKELIAACGEALTALPGVEP